MIDVRGQLRSVSALAAVAFVLNLAWEMGHASLFSDMAGLSFWSASRRCLLATVGDVAIVLAAYAGATAAARCVPWISPRRWLYAVLFSATAFALSTLVERHAVAAGRWKYAPEMPTVPWLEIGLSPALQWLVIPWLSLELARLIMRKAR